MTVLLYLIAFCFSQEISLDTMEEDIKFTEQDKKTGLPNVYKAKDYKTRVSFFGGLNGNLMSPFDVYQFDGVLSVPWNSIWIEGVVSFTSGLFSSLTIQNPAMEADSRELSRTRESLLSLGIGISHQTRLFLSVLGKKSFEKTAVYVCYNSFTENLTTDPYKGPGIKANYGVYWRFSRMMHWGFQLNYNLASVRRPGVDDEPGSERSLVLSWMSLGIEWGWYY